MSLKQSANQRELSGSPANRTTWTLMQQLLAESQARKEETRLIGGQLALTRLAVGSLLPVVFAVAPLSAAM